MLLDYDVKSDTRAVLAQLGKAVSTRGYFDTCHDFMAGQMHRREALEAEAAERGVAVPDHGDYDTWRDVTDYAVGRYEGLMADRGNFGIHLDCIALREESLGSALSRECEVLEDDDRHLAATLAGQREGECLRMREERIARLLDDPERLRKLSIRAAIGACKSRAGLAAGERGKRLRPSLDGAPTFEHDRILAEPPQLVGEIPAGATAVYGSLTVSGALAERNGHKFRWLQSVAYNARSW